MSLLKDLSNPVLSDPVRLKALYQTGLLDSAPERVFDRITEIVCKLLNVPVSLVSLIDADRQFFKSAQGLPEPVASERQTPLSYSFCQHVVMSNQPLVIEDARNHPLVCDNLAIRDFQVIAYLGLPVVLPGGEVAGSLCAIDNKPRVWSKEDIGTLEDLAQAVMAEIQIRHLLKERQTTEIQLRKQQEQLTLAADVAGMGLFEWDLNTNTLTVYANLHQMYGSEPGQEVNLERFFSLVHPEDVQSLQEKLSVLAQGNNPANLEFRLRLANGERWILSKSELLRNAKGEAEKLIGVNFDITEQKKLQLALKESEERYRLISSVASDYMFSANVLPDNTLETSWVTESFVTITGYTLDEINARGGWRSIIHPEDLHYDNQDIAKLRANQKVFSESRIIHKNGSVVWLRNHIHPIWDNEKNCLLRVHGATQDITARKQMELSVRESEQRFSQLFQQSPFTLTIASLETGQLIDVNQTFIQRTGYSREEAIGKTTTELGLWFNPQQRNELIKLAKQDGSVSNFEIESCSRSGQVRIGLCSAYILEFKGEKQLVVATRDITAEKKAQKAQKESEQKFSKLFLNSPVSKILTSFEDHRIVDVNETFIKDSGYSRNELIGKTAREIRAWTDEEETFNFIQMFQSQGYVRGFEANMSRKDGQKVNGLLSAEVLELANRKYVLSTILDITNQRKAEQTVRESEQKFSKLFHHSPVAMSVTFLKTNQIVNVNEAFLKISGFSRKEIVGKTSLELNSWANLKDREDFFRIFMQEGCVKEFEAAFFGNNNDPITGLLSAEVIELEGEKYVISTVLDITNQRKAEETLRESEAKFSALFHNNPLPTFVSSRKDKRIVDCNESFLRESGFSRQEILGKTAQELNIWVNLEDHIVLAQQLQKQGKVRHLEIAFRKKSGEVAQTLFSADIVKFNGEWYVVATSQDITAQRKAEETLRQSESRFAKIFQNSPFGIIVIDIHEDRIIDANEQFTKDTGYSREEILSTPSFGNDMWVSLEAREQATRMLAEQGYIKDFTFQFKCKSGELGWAQTSAEFFESNGKTYLIRTNRNITDLRKMEQALQEERNLLRTLIDALPDYITVKDKQSRFLLANQSTIDHMKMDPEKIMGSTDHDYYPKHLADSYFQKEQHIIQTGEMLLHHEEENITPDGQSQWVMTTKVPLNNHHGDIVGLIGSSRDITALKRTEQALRESEERYRVVAETATDAIITIDHDSVIHYLNPGTEQMFGYPETELLHQKITLLMPDYLRTLHEVAMANFLETGIRKHDWSGIETTGLHKDGHKIPLEISFSEFSKQGKRFFTGIIRDISERKTLLNRLEHMAYRDALTNLPNRAMLRERLDYLLTNHQDDYGLALLFIDLDNFKIINDSLGHELGDEALKIVATRLGDSIRSDDMVARLGGDEFVILLNNVTNSEDITRISQKILRKLDYPIHLNTHEVSLGGSMGIALFPRDGRTTVDLLRSADLAMYQAKKERGTFKFYTDELNKCAQERLSLESDLRIALANHEITVHYQPRIDLLTGRITGAEALARWIHPQKGFISPGRFIPIAEETGLIHSLGLDVLRQACLQLKHWQKQGYPSFRLSVNLSPQQLHHPNLIKDIKSILEQIGLEPLYLELEVTESGAMNNIKESMPTLQAFRDMGIHIAIDDFGTGYSSLSYLQRLPIDSLKIDRSFLMDIGNSEHGSGEVIAKVITSLGKNLGLKVVAEGIETTQQLKFLLQIQCDEAQGFLFSKPLPASDFEQYLISNNTKNLLMTFKQGHPTLF